MALRLGHKLVLAAVSLLSFTSLESRAQIFDFFDFITPQQQAPQQRGQQSQQQSQRITSSANYGEVDFIYNTIFEYKFDNREFNKKPNLSRSQTLNSARVTPEIGLQVASSAEMTHKLKLGIDVMKDMGENTLPGEPMYIKPSNLFREMTLYYQIESRRPKTHIQALVGVYPNRYSEVDWGLAFLSDSIKFYDHNSEGFLIKIAKKNFYSEVGLDWNGKFSTKRRENFITFGYAEGRPAKFLSLGIYGTYTHHAGSVEVPGVVDNGLIEPFVNLDLSKYLIFDRTELKLGYLQSIQRDRIAENKFIFPGALEFISDFEMKGFGLKNSITYGQSLTPFWNIKDISGNSYSRGVYRCSPLYQMTSDPSQWNKMYFYDRLETYYRPKITEGLDLAISFVCHFGNNYFGTQQKISLLFNLDKISSSAKTASTRARQAQRQSSRGRQQEQRAPLRGLQIL